MLEKEKNEMFANTIEKDAVTEIDINKSKFLGFSFFVENREDAENKIKAHNEKYKDATHNVYAYRVVDESAEVYSDDGEPSGTSGPPILDILRKRNYTNTLIIVTRYFGGILLGTGGLVKAYSTSASITLEESGVLKAGKGKEVEFEIPYDKYDKIKNALDKENIKIKDQTFEENVKVKIEFFETENIIPILEEINEGSLNIISERNILVRK
ncbi:MAG: YigZ family protein [Methanosarcinaceae archaeon]|nr:YigZ family protein [Methanosarcinaceae archaeon]